MTLIRSRLALISLILVTAVAALGFIALRTLPASSHGNVTVLECNVVGTGGDNAAIRGIQFNVSQSFVSVDVRMAGSVAGVYAITAELRRSTGFTGPFSAASRSGANLPLAGTPPYQYVHFDFPLQGVFIPGTSFTLKFVDITGPGTLYIEQTGFVNLPCPNVMETNENNVDVPTERSEPAGFIVSTLRTVQWGDVDCSNGVPNATDALKILRYVAGLSTTKTLPCPNFGDLVRP